MPALDTIRLSAVKVVDQVSTAAVGTLLQISLDGADPEIYLRAQLSRTQHPISGILSLEGSKAGIFFVDGEFGSCPGIDVTDLTEIFLSSPAPHMRTMQANPAGSVYQASDRSGETSLVISARLQTSDQIIGYAQLTDPGRGQIAGIASRFYIGKAIVEKLQKSSAFG